MAALPLQIESAGEQRQPIRSVFLYGSVGVILRFLAQPPSSFWPLVFLAPALWWLLVADPRPVQRRGYFMLWLIGSLFWLITMQGTRLANPALYPAWFALGLYLGSYLPLFVGLSRVAVHQHLLPAALAGPAVWVGLELIRGYAFTGYSGSLLGHSLAHWPAVFQILDLCGSYTASWLVVAVGLALNATGQKVLARRKTDQVIGPDSTPAEFPPTLPVWRGEFSAVVCGALTLLAAILYGSWRIGEDPHYQNPAPKPMINIAMLQADVPAIFEGSHERDLAAFYRYVELSRQAAANSPDRPLDLVVWPESMFGAGQVRIEFSTQGFEKPPEYGDISREEFVQQAQLRTSEFDQRAASVQAEIARISGAAQAPYLMVGASLLEFSGPNRNLYSCALTYDRHGNFDQWYGKRHLVMFGEYIPFGNWLPWLYQIGPLSYGVTPGPKSISLDMDGTLVAPSICFETMVEHGANQQIRQLQKRGEKPHLLVNITNDGWFHGSAILDHHLRSAQAAAAAHHTPIVIAANSGITAWIDGSGQIRASLPRQTDDVLFAAPLQDQRGGLYSTLGDWTVRPFAILCAWLAWCGWRASRKNHSVLARAA